MGKVIVLRGATVVYQIQSAWSIPFEGSTATNHADLINLEFANSGHIGFQPDTNALDVGTPAETDYVSYYDVASGTHKKTLKSNVGGSYTLPTASEETLGGIKVGSRLTIADGVLSADAQGGGLVAVSSNDTTASYLGTKLVAGSGITLTENNNAGNETLSVGVSSLFAKVPIEYTLPASPSSGYIVDIVGLGTNWIATASTDHHIRVASNLSAFGGTLSSGSGYDCATLIYIGSVTWLVKSSTGVLTLDVE